MKTVFLLILAFALTGCAHQTRQQMMADQLQAKSVCDANNKRPELAPLRTAVPDRAQDATVEQLADKSKPNDAQKDVIAKIDAYDAPCRAAVMSYLQRWAPAAAAVRAKSSQEMKILWARLFSGELTFGQFNSERAKLAAESQAEMESVESARAAQAQSLQAQQYQNYLQMQQNINSFRPKTTNCYRYGNNIQCTQY